MARAVGHDEARGTSSSYDSYAMGIVTRVYGLHGDATQLPATVDVKFTFGLYSPLSKEPVGLLRLISNTVGSSLFRAAAASGSARVLSFLLNRGVPVCTVEPHSLRSALHLAAAHGEVACVAALLGAGAASAVVFVAALLCVRASDQTAHLRMGQWRNSCGNKD